jgi:hypothetical protein
MGEWRNNSITLILHTPSISPSGKRRPMHVVQLGETHSRFERYGEEKNSLLLTGIEPRFLGRLSSTLVAIPTEWLDNSDFIK